LLSAEKPAESLIAERSAERRDQTRGARRCDPAPFAMEQNNDLQNLYRHTPPAVRFGQPVVTVCDGQKSEPLPLRLDLFNHSPTGFSWGYGGSGPAQLALALLADALGDDDRAVRLHQEFKFKVVAAWPEGERWGITTEQITAGVNLMEQENV